MNFLMKILNLLNEQSKVPSNTLSKFRVWADERNVYVDNLKAVKEFASEQENSKEVEEYILSVIEMRS